MRYSFVFVAAVASTVSGHGLITSIQGANGVTMPGLSVKDGTPRDCILPSCGSEADTSIIRPNGASPLGKTPGGGAVNAASAIAVFMGTGAAPAAPAAAAAKPAAAKAGAAKAGKAANRRRGLLDGLAGGLTGGGQGTKTPKGTVEQGVAAAAGTGATSGLPTAGNDGTITMTFHQVNQDGAGPLTAQIDPTSGGTDAAAFQDAKVTQNVPGAGIGGLSLVSATDFPVTVQMPAGMTCTGTVGNVQNVCVVRMQNKALAGPFGGSAAFTQTAAQKKRAIEYNARKARMARAIAFTA